MKVDSTLFQSNNLFTLHILYLVHSQTSVRVLARILLLNLGIRMVNRNNVLLVTLSGRSYRSVH